MVYIVKKLDRNSQCLVKESFIGTCIKRWNKMNQLPTCLYRETKKVKTIFRECFIIYVSESDFNRERTRFISHA